MVLHSWGFHVAELQHDTVGALWTKPCREMVCFVSYHVLLIYWIALFHSSLNVAAVLREVSEQAVCGTCCWF